MAKPGTTHVIEIETGIGEPAFIPLTVGQELQPISVGKKGMWRIESARVLDVHAFVYFDGTSLFVQSADESQSASVDGYRVGKAWTELHAPCKIEIGAARLRFRSLADQQAEEPAPPPASAPSPPRPAAGAPPLPESGSTRAHPIDGSGSRPVGIASNPPRSGGPSEDVPRSPRQTGMPVHSSGAPVQAIPQSQHPPNMMQAPHMMSGAHNLPNFSQMQPQNMPPPQMMQPNMMQPMMGSGAYASMSGSSNTMGGMGTGAYSRGAPTITTPPQDGLQAYIAKYKELNPTKRLLVLLAPFCLLASAYLLLFDDDTPAPPPRDAFAVDAGPQRPATVATTPGAPVSTCPQGLIPYSIPVNGQILCVPLGTPMPAVSTAPVAQNTAPPTQPMIAPVGTAPAPPKTAPVAQNSAPPPGSAPPGVAPGPGMAKTLERQAVDAVAINDYGRAAVIYEMLLQQNPNNRVYAEAARILRQKADAGAPPQ